MLTRSGVGGVGLVDTLSENNSETGFQMPVDVAVEEPGSGVVSGETDGNIVASATSVDNITNDRVNVVGSSLTGTANNVEVVLCGGNYGEETIGRSKVDEKLTPCKWKG